MKIFLASLLLVVAAQTLCPDLLEQLNKMPNIDYLDDHEQRHAKVMRIARIWFNYAAKLADDPNCSANATSSHPETNYGHELAKCLFTTMLYYVGMESRLTVQGGPIKLSSKSCFAVVSIHGPSPLRFKCAVHYDTGSLCENIPTNGTAEFTVTCQVGVVAYRDSLYFICLLSTCLHFLPVKHRWSLQSKHQAHQPHNSNWKAKVVWWRSKHGHHRDWEST